MRQGTPLEFVQKQLKKANGDIKNEQGFNSLHVAASRGDLFAVQQLVSAFNLVDEVSSKGATALVFAIMEEHVDCTKYLINAGADLYLKFHENYRPIDLIYSSENKEMKTLFEELTLKQDDQVE